MGGLDHSSLIPVLVTGIQCAQVLGRERVLCGADAPWLDSCDEHRNEGVGKPFTSPARREV